MKDRKFITRFFVSTAVAAFAFAAVKGRGTEAAPSVRPMRALTSGDVVDPATAPEVTKFSSATVREFAERVFGEAEEMPDLNELLSKFTCPACGKKCLLTSPRCTKGSQQSGKSDHHLSGDVSGNGSAVFDVSR